MRNLRMGFTLAEVLIVIGMIGVIAAITLPNLYMEGTKQQLGAKLADFATRLENISKQYSDDVDLTNIDDLLGILDAEFVFNDSGELTRGTEKFLKNGTSIKISNDTLTPYTRADSNAGKAPSKGIIEFKPYINGLNGQDSFKFYVTEKGVVYPEGSDNCTIALYEANYKATRVYNSTNCSGT